MKSVMDIEQINKVVDKVKIYKSQEDVIFDDFKNSINEFHYNYDTNNSSRIDEIKKQIVSKFSVITAIHNNNVVVFTKNIESYITISSNVRNKFNNIIK